MVKFTSFNTCKKHFAAILFILCLVGAVNAQITVSGSNNADGVYTSFTTATTGVFAKLNAATQAGRTITVTVSADIAETGTITALTGAAGMWTSLTISPSGARTISGTVSGGALFNFNGADNVTINGLNTGGNSLTISNTSTSSTSGTSTIQFVGDATNNSITNCSILGSATVGITGNGGNIFFSTGSSTGNDNNTVSNCNIGPAGSNLPTKCIYGNGSGSAATSNNNVTITNNNIYDFFSTSIASAGVYLNGGCNVWAISNNRFYQSATRTWASTALLNSPVYVSGTGTGGSQGHTVTGNIIGFSGYTYITGASSSGTTITVSSTASLTAGQTVMVSGGTGSFTTPVTITSITNSTQFEVSIAPAVALLGATIAVASGTYSLSGSSGRFNGIYFNGISGGTVSNIDKNVIAAISLTGVSSSGTTTNLPLAGIFINSGVVTSNDNIIGSQTATGSISYSSSSSSASDIVGIYNYGSNAWTSNNNSIGGITVANSSTGASNLYGLRANTASSVTWTCNNNTIGGTVANSLQSTSTSTASVVNGIINESPASTITGNIVRNLTAANGTGTTTSASVIGILVSASSANHTVSQNTISALSNTNSSGATIVTGIYYNATTGANTVARNFIHSLSTASTNATINGINIGGGTTTYSNNIIRLGINATGAAITTACAINGVNETSGTDNFYFNSIYVGGAGVGTTASNTFAFNSTVTANTRIFQNNIFVNNRSNATTGGAHFAIQVGGTAANPSGLTCNYNNYFVNGTGGAIGRFNGTTQTTIANWKTAVSGSASGTATNEGSSINVDPAFVNATAATPDLHLTNGTLCEAVGIAVAAVTDDFDGQARSGLTPVDLGADAGNYAVAGLNVGVTGLAAPTGVVCGATQAVTATVKNFGSATIDFSVNPVVVNVTGTGAATAYGSNDVTLNAGTLAAGASQDVSFPTINMSASGTYTFNAKTTLSGDINTGNDAMTAVNITSTVMGGTYSVGSSSVGGQAGNFATLTAAVAAYNAANCFTGNVTFILTNSAYNSGETFPLSINANSAAIAGNHTLTIKPNTGLSPVISNSSTAAVFTFNGAKNVTIDGSNTVNGTTKDLTILNSNTTVSNSGTIVFTNDATSNTVKNTLLQGVSTNANTGVVYFSSTATTTGNSNNTISNCNISGSSSSATPTSCVYSQGASTSILNTGNAVQNCNIFDYFISSGGSNGIYLNINNDNWTISGNKFYQTVARAHSTITASNTAAIQVTAGSVGDDFQITNNTIGYSSAAGTGTYTISGVVDFAAITISASANAAVSNISNNTITAISINSSKSGSNTSAPFNGIYVAANTTWANITGNTIGSLDNTTNISLTSTSSSAADFNGIFSQSTSAQTTDVSNNNIGSITINNASAGNSSFYGIYTTGTSAATYTITNNKIGFAAAAAINCNTTHTSTEVWGIMCNSGKNTITGNTVSYLNMTAANVGSVPNLHAMMGIGMSSSGTGVVFSQNLVHSLSNTATNGAVQVVGLMYDGPTTGTNVIARNLVHSLSGASSNGQVSGIYVNTGTATIQNNMVRLGIDNAGNSITTPVSFIGIRKEGSSATALYFNSIYIGGAGVGTTATNTYALYRTTTTTDPIQNNILANVRSNSSSGGKHYAVYITSTTGTGTVNGNVYRYTGNGGLFAYRASADVSAYTSGWLASDVNSNFANPNFANPTGNATTVDLHLASPTSAEANGVAVAAVTDDYDGQTRSGLTPVDIGADAGNFTSLDVTNPVITAYTALSSICTVTDQPLNAIAITDAGSGVPTTGGNVPRIYFNKNGGAWSSAAGTYTGSNWNFSLPVLSTLAAQPGDTINYYVVAQDVTGNVVSSPSGASGSDVNTITTHPTTPNSFFIGLSGVINIGTGNSGGKYPNLTTAISAYNTIHKTTAGGIPLCGNVTFSLLSSYPAVTETVPMTIAVISNASNYTLTIKPATGTSPVITGSNTGGLLVLNGADYVIIDGSNTAGGTTRNLTITNTSTSSSATAILLTSLGTGAGASNNTIKNCNISTGASTTTSYGISVGATQGAAGADNDNVTIQNNVFTVANTAIYAIGTSAGTNNALTISGNSISNTTSNGTLFGVRVGYSVNSTVTSNSIALQTTNASAPVGISAETGFVSSSISGNNITNVSSTASGGYGGRGITIGTGSTNSALVISNNFISGINGSNWNAFSNSSSMGIGIGTIGGSATLTTTTGGVSLYYNSISMTGSMGTGSSTAITASLYVGSGASALDIRNNIFSNTQVATSTTQKNYAIYSAAASTAFTTINYNNYYVTNSFNSASAIPGFLTSDRTNLAGIQSGFGQNANSVILDPQFVSASDLHVSASGTNMNAIGTPVSVTTDYDGVTRDGTSPDIGADEFTVAGCIAPNTLNASAIGYQQATVSWVAPSTGTPVSYNWEIRTTGAGGSGASGLTTSGSTTAPTVSATTGATALTINTSYNLYVQTDCGGGSTSGWAGPYNFSTLSCAVPTTLGANTIGVTSANVTWAAPATGSPVGYEWEVRTTGAGGSGASGLTTSGSTTAPTTSAATGSVLSSNTSYNLYVRTKCTAGSDYSAWAGPFNFVTACATPTYAAFPYSHSFESWVNACGTTDVPSANWSNAPVTGNNSWRRNDQGTSASWSSPTSGAYSATSTAGTYSARFHSWNTTASGNLDLYINCSTGPATKELSFDYNNTNGSDILQVLVSTNGGTSFTQLGSDLGIISSSAWVRQYLNFTSTSATTIIRLRATGDNGSTDIGIDDLKVDVPCAPVYAAYPYSESFESWIGCTGTLNVPGSNWASGPLPSVGNNCWRRNDQGATAVWNSPTSGVYSTTSTVGTYSARFHSWNTTSSGNLDLYIDCSTGPANKQVSFDYNNIDGTDILQVLVSTNGGSSFTQVGSSLAIVSGTIWTRQFFNFTSTSATTIIRLRATGDNGSTDIGIDNLKVEEPCAPVYATLPFAGESFESWTNCSGTSNVPSTNWTSTPFPSFGNNVWRRNDQGVTAIWSSPTSGVYSTTSTVGTYSARFHSWNTTSSGSLDFYIDLSSSTASKQISFDYINTSGSDVLGVFVSTNGPAGPFTQLGANLTTQSAWGNKTFTITSNSATTVIRLTATGDNGSTDIGVDNFQITVLSPIAISTITATQQTGGLAVNTTNNDIMMVNVATTGSTGGLALNSLKITSANTSDANFGTIKLWGGPTATASSHGSTVLASGTFSGSVLNFTGLSQALVGGNNYFWISYDVQTSATAGHVADLKILAGDMTFTPTSPSVATGTQPASLLDPAGNRPIMAALCGSTYTINNTLPTAGLNYNNFTDAVNDLNTYGLSCAVVFNVKDGQTFNEKVPAITTTGTATNTITFQRDNSGASRPTLVGTTGTGTSDAVLQLNGVDYLRWDGINISNNAANATATTQFEYGIFMNALSANGCKNNIIRNSNISLTTANTSTRCVYTLANSISGGDNSNNQFLNMQVSNAMWGYSFDGATSGPYDNNNEINTSGGGTSLITGLGSTANSATYGVVIGYQTNFKFKNTTFANSTMSSGGDLYGFNSSAGANNTMEVSGNVFTGISHSGLSSARVRCVSIAAGTSATVSGNTFAAITTTGYLHGIFCGSGTLTATNNTIGGSLANALTSTGSSALADGITCSSSGSSNHQITGNNISYIIANGGGGTTTAGITTNSQGTVIDGNTIQNLSCNGTLDVYGVLVEAGSVAGSIVRNNTISNLSGSNTGDVIAIEVEGPTTTVSNNNISNISSSSSGGVWAINTIAASTIISGNSVYGLTTSSTGNCSGIVASGGGNNVIIRSNTIKALVVGSSGTNRLAGAIATFGTGTNLVEKNVIDSIITNASSGTYALGIRASGISNTTNIFNNMISGIRANTANSGAACAVRGISIDDYAAVRLYHNTVYLTGTSTNSGFVSGAVYSTTNATLDSRNNILYNAYTGTGSHTVIYFTSSVTTYNTNLNAASNNNLMYAGTPGTNNLILLPNAGGNKQTVADYIASLTSPKESASFTLSSIPFVSTVSPVNLRIDLTSSTLCALNNKGVQITSTPTVPDDIDTTNVRSTTPDVGADEWIMPTPNAGTVTASANPVCNGSITIGVTGQSTGSEFAGQWQRDAGSGYVAIDATTDGATYTNFATTTLTITSVTGKDGYKYRYVVTRCTPTVATGTSNELTLAVNCNHVWQGDIAGSATDWFNAGNWSNNVVPASCADNVIIPTSPVGGPNFPVITGASAQVGNITVQSGATISIDNARTLSVCGDFTGSSTATASTVTGAGKVVLTGSAAQAVSGRTTFSTLQVAKTTGTVATVQSGSNLSVTTALELASGNLTNSGSLTLKSTATTHAIFNDFGAPVGTYTGTYTGSINEERYYRATSANSYNQHYMGSPVANATLAQFGAGGTSGAVTPTADCSETQLDQTSVYGSVFSYNEANGATCPMKSWTVRANSTAATPAQGFSVAKTGAGTLTVSGTPNTASSYAVAGLTNSNWTKGTLQHPSNTAFGSGWHMVSNPYNATLDLTSITPPAGFDNQIQVWDVIQGQYYTLTGTKLIAPFQAFFVHKTSPGGSATYTIDGNWRTATPATFYAQSIPEQLTITATNTANQLYDVTTVGFNQSATEQFDPQYDANKLTGSIGRHNLSTRNNGYELNTNILSSIQTTSTVNMTFEPGSAGTYTLTFEGLNSFDPTSYIMLEDKQLNTMHDVRSGDYTFTATAQDDWNRFVLHFTPKAEIATTDQQCETLGSINITQPGSANWTYTLTDNNNTTVSNGTLNEATPIATNVPAGTYTLTLTDNNNYQVIKTVTVNGTTPIVAAFSPSGNVTTTNTDVAFNSSTTATDYYWDFGDGTTATGQNVIHSYGDTGTYTVSLIVVSANGCSNTTTQTVTVNAEVQTGLNNLNNNQNITIWSNGNTVYVDFSRQVKTDATVEIYNILGQQLVNEKYGRSSIFTATLDKLEAGYVIVKVRNNNNITTRRLVLKQ